MDSVVNTERLTEYSDITDDIMRNSIPNYCKIPEVFKYKKFNLSNSSFDVKGITEIERLTLNNIQSLIGGQFRLLHRVNIDGIRTPDAEYVNRLLHKMKQYYDIKAPRKSLTLKSKKQKILRQFNEARGQSKNIIVSLLRDECDLSSNEANKQILECLSSKRYFWISTVILIGKNNYIKVYKKRNTLNEKSF